MKPTCFDTGRNGAPDVRVLRASKISGRGDGYRSITGSSFVPAGTFPAAAAGRMGYGVALRREAARSADGRPGRVSVRMRLNDKYRKCAIEPLEDRRLMATYYVSPTGSDLAAGTSTTAPWKTLNKVSIVAFKAGDQILLKGGSTFGGGLYFDSGDLGSAAAPIKISSYGTGVATIQQPNNKPGIYAWNTAGITISKLNLVGRYNYTTPTNLTGMPDGISFYNDKANNIKLQYVKIDGVDVRGFNTGIKIGGGNAAAGFRDVSITNSKVHDNLRAGIFTHAVAPNSNLNVYVARVQAWNNTGVPFPAGTTPAEVSGSGIILGSVNGGKVERSVAWNNGRYGDGGAGIWAYDSMKVTIQYNESYENRTAGKRDGDGFDLDQNTSYSVMQYNYSHDNHGGGFLMATKFNNTAHTNNVVRYNISQNDGRKNSYGAIHMWGRIRNTEVYNNTVFLSPRTNARPIGIRIHNNGIPLNDLASVHFRNNIIVTTGGAELIEVTADQVNGATDLKFQGNAYWTSGGSFRILYGGTTYTSISGFRNRGQEKVGTMNVGFVGDPQLNAPGGGGVIWNADNLSTITAYKLKSTSPLINRGLNLKTLFAVDMGTRDFWGDALPRGTAYDIGADEAA
jgi:hypothetical protein